MKKTLIALLTLTLLLTAGCAKPTLGEELSAPESSAESAEESAAAASEEAPSQAAASEEQSGDKILSLASVPDDPTDTFVRYSNRTEAEINELVQKSLVSPKLDGSQTYSNSDIIIYIKAEYWKTKTNWNKQNFPKIEFFNLKKMTDHNGEPYLWAIIRADSENSFVEIAKKLYAFDYVEFVERDICIAKIGEPIDGIYY